jgi:hypothetical protein
LIGSTVLSDTREKLVSIMSGKGFPNSRCRRLGRQHDGYDWNECTVATERGAGGVKAERGRQQNQLLICLSKREDPLWAGTAP